MNKILIGDCLIKLKELEDNSVDSIVTDPPYELGFMGKSWDNTGIANNKEMWAECLRVLKPGGYLLAFSGTRTYHRMASAIEDAGFEVRDMIEWVYGSGFPKSLNIGKAVDKLQGNEREVLGEKETKDFSHHKGSMMGKETTPDDKTQTTTITETKGTSEWEGWGTALKPAHEPICMARKPLAEKTVAENCLKWGTGGINIDESRVGTEETGWNGLTSDRTGSEWDNSGFKNTAKPTQSTGRFPANLILEDCEEVRECFPDSKSQGHWSKTKTTGFGEFGNGSSEYLGVGEKDKEGGNASRFFKSIIYQAKASKSERNKGLEDFPDRLTDDGRQKSIDNAFQRGETPRKNNHPTVKPIALMEYLIKMVTPKGGVVLDPFAGSFSTGVACVKNGFGFVGIEREEEYVVIGKARLEQAQKERDEELKNKKI